MAFNENNEQCKEVLLSLCRNSRLPLGLHFMAHPCFSCKIAGIINGCKYGLLNGGSLPFMVPAMSMQLLPCTRIYAHK